jgi:hypothetical protein
MNAFPLKTLFEHIQCFLPSISCHPLGGVHAFNAQLRDAQNIRMRVIKEAHVFKGYATDSIQTLKVLLLAPKPNFNVIKAAY